MISASLDRIDFFFGVEIAFLRYMAENPFLTRSNGYPEIKHFVPFFNKPIEVRDESMMQTMPGKFPPIYSRSVLGIIIMLIVTSCNFTQSGQKERALEEEQQRFLLSCAERRLDNSFEFHETAKGFLASYYKTRKESELFFSWYASEDSVYMARSVRSCWDKRNKHFLAAKNIFQKNRVLQRLIVQNMRQVPQAQLSELYLEDYQQLFVRDIQ